MQPNYQAEIQKIIPYDINTILTQIYQYKLFETNLIGTLFLGDQNLKSVCLINNYWFNHWKKVSCYKIIKDKIELNAQNNNMMILSSCFTTIFMNMNLMENYEHLDAKIDNDDIKAENFINPQLKCVDWESEFDIISPELWTLFVPNGNINQNSLINMNLEFLSNDSRIINISDNAGYVIFWNNDKQELGKFILKFEDSVRKGIFVEDMKVKSFRQFYKQKLSHIKEGQEASINFNEVMNIKCINKSEVNLPSKNPYKSPCGLINIQMTCYMNSALQSLFNIKKLTNYLINLKTSILGTDMSLPLLKAYLKTILFLSRKAEGSKKISEFAPKDFFASIKNENEFNELAGDSYDVVRHFFQKMHEQLMPVQQEMTSVFSKYMITNPVMNNNLPQNDIQSLNAFVNSYAASNRTIIANLFYFIERSITKCSHCKYSTSNFNVQMSVIFALEDIRQWKHQKQIMDYMNQNNMNNNNMNMMNNNMNTNQNNLYNNNMNNNNNMNMMNNNMNTNQNNMNNNNMNMMNNNMNMDPNNMSNNINMNSNSNNLNNNINMNQNNMNNNNNMNMMNNNMNMDPNSMSNNINMNQNPNNMNNNINMNPNNINNNNMNNIGNNMALNNMGNNMNMNNMNNNNIAINPNNFNNNMDMNNINMMSNPMNNTNNNNGNNNSRNVLGSMFGNMPTPNPMSNPMPNMQNIINNQPFNIMANNNFMLMMNANMIQMNNMQIQLNNMFPLPHSVDLMDAFQHYKKDNQLGGQNKLYCQQCGNTCDHIQSNHFYTLPEYLVINLNRGEGNKFQVGSTFPEILDLTNEVQTSLESHKYRLIGVITHLGPHGTGGHYIAYGFLEEKNMWYKFDDSRVTESTFNEAKTSKPFDNYRCDPYILFYHRLEN